MQPVGTIVVNGNAAVTDSGRVTLTLSATDGSGVKSMQFSNDAVSWSSAENFAATKEWDVTTGDGPKQVYVKYLDAAGNWSETFSATIILDITPPVAMAAPAGALYRTPQTVTLTASEAAVIYYTTDGTTPFTASAVYNLPISIPASATLSFFARDPAGNSSPVKSESYTIDTTPPVVKITSHANGQYINSTTITLSGALDDQTAQVTVNGRPAQVTAGSFSLSGIVLVEGENSLAAEAKDPAGNPGSDSITLNLDTAQPVITVTEPTVNAFLNTPQITVTGSVNEPVTSLTANGQPVTLNGLSFTSTLTLAEGPNTLTIKAKDRAGNEGTISIPVNLDTIPPLLAISTLSDGAFTNNETLNISGTVTDDGGLDKLLINGAVVPVNADGSYSQALILKTGANSITVEAIDKAANKSSSSRTINLDQAAPQLTITTPADNSKTGVRLVEITGTVDEQATVEIKFKESVQQAVVTGNSFTATVIPEYGYNTIEITARDRAGNPGTQKRTVIFDDKKPAVAITTPAQDLRTNISSLTIKGLAMDADGLTAVGVTVTMDGATFTPAVVSGGSTPLTGLAFEQSVTFTEEKAYSINVTAKDEVGNETSVQRNIIYDITPPAITVTPLATPVNQSSQTISGVREAGTTVVITSSTATIGAVTYPTETTWEATVTGLGGDINDIVVTAADIAGNLGNTVTQIIYDTTPPVITVTAPSANAFMNIPQITVTGSVSEPVTAVTVNGVAANLIGNSFTAVVTLVEGANSIEPWGT